MFLAASWVGDIIACEASGWHDAYGGERCWNDGNILNIKCEDKGSGSNCGGRVMNDAQFGIGDVAVRIKAAPGSGVVTSFYLSNNGGMFVEGGSWNEIDFEIMGNQANEKGTKIWTNFFTGQGVEHHGFYSVPFDVSAEDHIYTIRLNLTHVQWLVDDRPLRTSSFTEYQDMVDAVNGNSFQRFASVWGKAWSDPPLGACQEFTDGMGKMDDNPNGFPLVATFEPIDGKPPGEISNRTAWGEVATSEPVDGKPPGEFSNDSKPPGEISNRTEELLAVDISSVTDEYQQVGLSSVGWRHAFTTAAVVLSAATAVSAISFATLAAWRNRYLPPSAAEASEALTLVNAPISEDWRVDESTSLHP